NGVGGSPTPGESVVRRFRTAGKRHGASQQRYERELEQHQLDCCDKSNTWSAERRTALHDAALEKRPHPRWGDFSGRFRTLVSRSVLQSETRAGRIGLLCKLTLWDRGKAPLPTLGFEERP